MNPFKTVKPPPPQPLPAPLPAPPAQTDQATADQADANLKPFTGGGRAANYLTAGGTDQSSSAVRFLGGAGRT